jgi:hypothetical protein
VSRIIIAEGENNDIIGAGEFNSTKNNETQNDYFHLSKGIFTFRLNSSDRSINYSEVHPFSYDIALKGWAKDDEKKIYGNYKILNRKQTAIILEGGENYDNFSPFAMDDVRKMKDHIGLDDFSLLDVMEHDGEIIVLSYTYNYAKYNSIIAVNFDKSGNFMYEKKFGVAQEGVSGRAFYLFKHEGSPAIIFPDNIKNTQAAELTKSPYLADDKSSFNAVIFDNNNPERIVAFKRNEKPKIKLVLSVTKTSDSEELIYLIDVAGEGLKLTRMR